MSEAERPKSLMRSLGEFVGHITRAVGTPVSPPADSAGNAAPNTSKTDASAAEVHSRQQTEERTVYTEDGKRMILRRTVIEEVEVEPPGPSGDENEPPRGSV